MAGKRMTFKQRALLQISLENPRTKSLIEISKKLNLNRVTLYNEILNRRISKGSTQFAFNGAKPKKCELLNHFPFCCNACYKLGKCSREIFIYDAYDAHREFETTKRTCATGPQISSLKIKEINKTVSPRVKMGQSLFHIVNSSPDLECSEQTIRRYINKGYLDAKAIDLPRTVQRRVKNNNYEKRKHVNVEILFGRMFDDYILFKKQYPDSIVLEIDFIVGKRTDKKAILTIFEPITKFQIGVIMNKSSTSVNYYFENLIKELNRIESKFFDVILTDNGFEFKDLFRLENDENGVFNFKLFYCDPYSSYQKGGCEKNHEFFRYVKRKGISFDQISQNELDSIFSNINSLKRKSLKGLSPYQCFAKKFGYKAIDVFNIKFIESSNIILK